MIPFERQQKIYKLIEEDKISTLEELLTYFREVSESTLRRDLKALEEDEQIVMQRGGKIRLVESTSFEQPVRAKAVKHVEEKRLIARKAASLIKNGESVFLDSGTTVLLMLEFLQGKEITVVTTNLMVPQEMQRFPELDKISCIILGGSLQVEAGSTYGTMTNDLLRQYYFDRAFIGISGISERAGMNTPDEKEAQKKQIAVRNSRRAYILADSSKFGVTTMCKGFEPGEVPVICEKQMDSFLGTGSCIVAEE
jgi:DeoR family fructose operon transcriptional repressor